MKNLKVTPFKSPSDASEFLAKKGCLTSILACDQLLLKGYFTFKKWHIVVDPNGELEQKPITCIKGQWANTLENWFHEWRKKK